MYPPSSTGATAGVGPAGKLVTVVTGASITLLPPLSTATVALTHSPFVIGRSRDAAARLDHPMLAPEHVVLLQRAEGWWLTTAGHAVHINGRALVGGEQPLQRGDIITLAAGAVVRFDDGSPDPTPAAPAARPLAAAPRRRWRAPEWNLSPRALLVPSIVLGAFGMLGGFSWIAWKSYQERPAEAPVTLGEADGALFDSLFTITLDHVERGNILLEAGARQAALTEFGAGLSTLSTSRLRNLPYVMDRLEELRTSIGEVYRSKKVAVPPSFVAKAGGKALRGSGLAATLSTAQFADALRSVSAAFQQRFGRELVITGRDHPEHLSLYGSGGAIDLRARDLSRDQVAFIITAAREAGIRVKDFSRDDVLRAQIAAAMKAGLADRASTGLHLHLDRFANRRDRWTVP